MMNETGRPPERPATNQITALNVAPRLVITLELEGRPTVREDATGEGDSLRLQDWIKSQPRLHRLVYDAARLAREAA
jgi:hypothetical protein